ncbi:putative BOI-related E3 ubiquitin-protein ligase 3 [Carex littledalei]|uniref:Putative BOI-related E3 ubiquitin-protein ligase 3 n=1 Tax=Carex littledalei TaxID=544730 RepID=A0A833VNM7_9POAL|nr:putative BOI-related E3 ubiquitin-protein ligase 3 [Carex littledalei]
MVKRIGIFIDIPDGKRSRIKAKEHLSCLETESDLKQKLEEAKAEAEFYKFRCEIKEEELDELRRSEKQKVEEAKADAEFYKFKCAMKDEELDELRQSENKKVEEAKADTEYYKFKCDMKDEELDELRQSEKQKVEEAKADNEYYKFKCDMKDEELDKLRESEKELLDELKRAKTRAKLHQRLIEELQLLLDEDEPRRHVPAAGAVGEASGNWDEITCGPETWHPTTVCSRCRDEEACLVVLPCNHLCLCLACELETDRCPDCRATKSGSVLA